MWTTINIWIKRALQRKNLMLAEKCNYFAENDCKTVIFVYNKKIILNRGSYVRKY